MRALVCMLMLLLSASSCARSADASASELSIESVMAESSVSSVRASVVAAVAADDECEPLELSDLGHKGLVVAGWSWVALGAALVAGADADEVKPLAGLMFVGLGAFVVDVVRQ